MAIFYHVVEGDPLDSGGSSRVIEGNSSATIKGEDGRSRAQAFLGHKAWCDACKSAGVIVAGPGTPGYDMRLFDEAVREHEAVEGDLVACRCERPARIIAVYGRRSSINTYAENLSLSGSPSGNAPNGASAALAVNFGDRYVLLEASGEPLANVAYAVERGSGTFEYGETDHNGQTHLLSAVRAAEHIKVYLAG